MSYLWSIRITFRLLLILFVIKLYAQTDFFAENNLLELEKYLFEMKKYYDYGDIEYKGIRVQEFHLICQLTKIIINQ